jgi:hypothetical protein
MNRNPERTADLRMSLANVESRLEDMNAIKSGLDVAAKKRADSIMWGGLCVLCCQWGAFARLTW